MFIIFANCRKYSLDQIVISFGFFINGITSTFTCLMSADLNLCSKSAMNSSFDFSHPLNSLILSCRCLKSKGILFRMYHSKSYQSSSPFFYGAKTSDRASFFHDKMLYPSRLICRQNARISLSSMEKPGKRTRLV